MRDLRWGPKRAARPAAVTSLLASVLPWSMAGVGYQSGLLLKPRHWGDSEARRAASAAQSEADSARRVAAQAKRDRKAAKHDRKAAKHLRDAKGGGDA